MANSNFLSRLSFFDISLPNRISNKTHHITYLASRTNVKNIELLDFSKHRGELYNEKELCEFYHYTNKFYQTKDIKFYMNIPVSKYFLDFTKKNNIKNICVSNIEKNNPNYEYKFSKETGITRKEHPNYIDIDLLIPEFYHADSYNKNSTKHKYYDNVKLDMYIDKYYYNHGTPSLSHTPILDASIADKATFYRRKFEDDMYLVNVFYPAFNNITIKDEKGLLRFDDYKHIIDTLYLQTDKTHMEKLSLHLVHNDNNIKEIEEIVKLALHNNITKFDVVDCDVRSETNKDVICLETIYDVIDNM